MPRRLLAHVKPALLRWGRETAGLTVDAAAQRIGVKANQLSTWESGLAKPTVPQLRAAANAYRRPLAAFFLPSPPPRPSPSHDFRLIRERKGVAQSPELLLEVRRARYRRETAFELARELEVEIPGLNLDADLDSPVEAIAIRARRRVGIPLDEQMRWREPYEALKRWISGLERIGTLVFQSSGIAVAEMRGFSVSERPLPVIVLNGADHPTARIFTLMHEFVHLLLRFGGVCDLHERHSTASDDRVEVFCNAVAAEILVPGESLLGILQVARASRDHEWTGDELKALADRYSVSREVVLRRLLSVGKTTRDHYERMRALFVAEYERLEGPRRAWGPAPDAIVIRNNGPRFAGLVLESYRRELITPAAASRFLGISVRRVPQIEAEFARA